MSTISIVLADDHQVVRQGLRALLEAEKDFRVIGEAGDGVEAVRLVENLRPQVIVVDLMMPGLRGLEVLHQLGRRAPETKVVILSMYANEGYVLEALHNGASAYVLKESSAADLVKAVHDAVVGRRFLSAPLSERALEAYAQKANGKPQDAFDTLSPREREVLNLAAEGHTNSEVAARLFISPRTVESHRASVMHKLGLHSHVDLVRFAMQRGILQVQTPDKQTSRTGKSANR